MILVIETGRIKTSIAIRDGDSVINFYNVLDSEIDLDFEKVIDQLLSLNGFTLKDIDLVILSSVIKRIEDIEVSFCKKNKLKFFNVNNKKNKLNFKSSIKDLKTDIISNVFYAVDLYKEDFIIVDMGSNTNFTIFEKELNGMVVSLGFSAFTSLLEKDHNLFPDFKEPKSIISNNSFNALINGNFFGFIGMIKEIVNRIKKELNKEMKVLITGGYSKFIIDYLDFDIQCLPKLTSNGSYEIYKYNNKKS